MIHEFDPYYKGVSMGRFKTKVKRAPGDVSPKVTRPSLILLGVSVVSAIVTGGWNAPETASAISALVVAVFGYFTTDKIEV